jgi:hypothetical protein
VTWLAVIAIVLILIEATVAYCRRRGHALDLQDARWARESVRHFQLIRDLPPMPIFERRLRRPMPMPRPDSSANVFLGAGVVIGTGITSITILEEER